MATICTAESGNRIRPGASDNIARRTDEPGRDLGDNVADAPEVQLAYVDEAGAPHRPGSLHAALEKADPAGWRVSCGVSSYQ